MKKLSELNHWRESINEVMHCDCIELMKKIPDKSIDLMLTDPPYTIHAKGCGGLHNSRDWLKKVHNAGIDEFSPNEFLTESKRILKKFHAYIFSSKNNLNDYITFFEKNDFNWEILIYGKRNPIPTKNNKYLSDKEYCLFVREKGGCYFNNELPFGEYKTIQLISVKPSQYGHPTEKDLDYIKKGILMSSKSGDLIFDPFAGSFTTAVACKFLKRNFISCDLEEDYCAIGDKRMQQQLLF